MNKLDNLYSLKLIKEKLEFLRDCSDLEMKDGDRAREVADYLLNVIDKTQSYADEPCYRWYAVDAQETCFVSIVTLLDGYFATAKEVYQTYPQYNPDKTESCFFVRKIDESEVPRSQSKRIDKYELNDKE